MKYMGSKRWMLGNGLGSILATFGRDTKRFVDLFAGSGAVAIHMARQFPLPVLAVDLQRYSAVLTGAIIQRQAALTHEDTWKDWYQRAAVVFQKHRPPKIEKITRRSMLGYRGWCERRTDLPLTRAYGGHYFGPVQATWIDALRTCLPTKEPEQTVALGALLHAASKCAAAPGHTAQPFQPTRSAKPFILQAWKKDIAALTMASFVDLAKLFAYKTGSVLTADANDAVENVTQHDLVFIDPPYSGVHYSRFYHVLESIAFGTAGAVSGVGRYPDREFRPRSRYSLKGESRKALSHLLGKIAEKGAKAIVTFPATECSNGLSGDIVRELAEQYFRVREKTVLSKFSTLGGTNSGVGKGR